MKYLYYVLIILLPVELSNYADAKKKPSVISAQIIDVVKENSSSQITDKLRNGQISIGKTKTIGNILSFLNKNICHEN